MINKHKLLLIFIIISLCYGISYAKKKPKWIIKPPQDPKFLYVVGASSGQKTLENAKSSAIENGISDIVKTFGIELTYQYHQKKTELRNEISKELKTKAQGKVENLYISQWYYEKMPDNSYEVYVLIKYPKAEIEKEKKRLLQLEADKLIIAQKEFSQGEKALQEGDIVLAFVAFCNSLKYAEMSEQGKIFSTKVRETLNSVVLNLRLEKESGESQEADFGTGLKDPLKVVSFFKGEEGEKVTPNVPIIFSFLEGKGEITGNVLTDQKGKAEARITKIEPTSQHIVIRAYYNFQNLIRIPSGISDEGRVFLESLSKALENKGVDFKFTPKLNIRKLRIGVYISEMNLDKPQEESIIGNTISEKLYSSGYQVIKNINVTREDIERLDQAIRLKDFGSIKWINLSQMDAILFGNVRTKIDTSSKKLSSCFAEGSLKAILINSGKTIATKSIIDVRGTSKDQERACRIAIKNLNDQISQNIVDQIIIYEENLQNQSIEEEEI